jgi:3',5'-nucleoside bisphosphate phosphatase
MKIKFIAILMLFCSIGLYAQNMNITHMHDVLKEKKRKFIHLPTMKGYTTMKCDFHMHTVFSDGEVWPTIRVDEAWEQGLDVISITDHIEYTPKDKIVIGDHNTSYEIAKPHADQRGIMLVKGSEITRGMPPGHFNALFLNNSNELDTPNYMDAFGAAKKQGAFIIWNHPGWRSQQPDSCKWWDIHTELLNKGMLHAIEVFNAFDYYPVAFNWCNEKDLTYIAASDIHIAVSDYYDLDKYHRPMTLVFAKDRSEAALKEALFAGRTLAWFGHNLAGKEELLHEFFTSSIKSTLISEDKNFKYFNVVNTSDVQFTLTTPDRTVIKIAPYGESSIRIAQKNVGNLEVSNLIIRADKKLNVKFPF